MAIDGERAQKQQQMAIIKEDEDGISLPNWLIDVLKWIKRIEMANSSLSFSCRLFKSLCWPKLHGVKPHRIEWMSFYGKRDSFGNFQASAGLSNNLQNYGQLRAVPIPNVPYPDYILGFNTINLYFLDDRVLEFIRIISPQPKWIHVEMHMGEWNRRKNNERPNEAFICLLKLLAHEKGQFVFTFANNLENFTQLYPCMTNQIQSIRIVQEQEFDALFNWLTIPQIEEGKQKILELMNRGYYKNHTFLERIRKDFSKATAPLNFFIHFIDYREREFTMANKNTGEVLNSYRNEEIGMNNLLLFRCPKGQEDRWKMEGEKKLKIIRENEATLIRINIQHFGTLNYLA